MKDPYQLLGLTPNASEEEIKEAYRRMARQLQDDPAGMGELNAAYDAVIQRMRLGGTGQTNAGFADIREKLKSNRVDDAEMLLDGIPAGGRNAEWYYLKGTVLYRRGWLEEAHRHFQTAVSMEPGNSEYQAAFRDINNTRTGGYRTARMQNNGCSSCDVCTGLICADCCCECMGGDLIPCC